MVKFFTKTGFLTFRAMACGYLHQTKREDGATIRFALNNAGMNVFEIEVWDGAPDEQRYNYIEGIKEARALYKKLCKGKPQKRERVSYESQDIPAIIYA